jgi:hypothetical protein
VSHLEAKYRNRLLRLAEFLEDLPEERFDFSVWVEDGVIDPPKIEECGTKACAIGWACTMPEFKRLGARLGVITRYDGTQALIPKLRADATDAYDVCEELFGLELSETEELFFPGGGIDGGGLGEKATPKQVAAKIREFVE